jgi:ATP-dependent exoDNAse (exonuclease V) alpha subunit
MNNSKIELNEQFKKALDYIFLGENVFITGRAGTGKSTLLSYFREKSKKDLVLLAPTGVAAVNIGGQTIHSFFDFKPNLSLQKIKKKDQEDVKIYKKLEIIIIDEISMVRADLLDCVDKFLRLNGPDENKAFGGVQMVFIGDLYQLPPVVSRDEKDLFKTYYKNPYFFSAKVFSDFDMKFLELEKVYRQKDNNFVRLLNSVRNRTFKEKDLEELNVCYKPDFKPNANDFYISLTTTNALADKINCEELNKIKNDYYFFEAYIKGDVSKEYYPASVDLELKIGAQVMLLNNDPFGRWVNGTIGKILDIKKTEDEDLIFVKLEDYIVEVKPYTWNIFKFSLKNNEIVSESIGTFTQYPLRLAFAITIHKSQGKTFDKVIIDIGKGTFAYGQMYVALSRCTNIKNLVLRQSLKSSHILIDYEVKNFLTKYQYQEANKNFSLTNKINLIKKAVKNKKQLRIVYLKSNDIKSQRNIKPILIEKMKYLDKEFLGLEAFCLLRKQKRVFNVEKILELEFLD